MTGADLKLLVDFSGNSKLANLTPAQWDELAGRFSAGGFTFTAFKHWVAAQGIQLSDRGVSAGRDRLLTAAARLVKKNAAMNLIRKEAASAGVTLTQAALEQSAIAVGDILDGGCDPETEEGQKLLLSGLTALAGARSVEVQDKRVTQQGAALKLATDKFQFDATKRCLAVLPALRKIAGDKSLDDRGRIDAARRILFGDLPEDQEVKAA